MGRRRRGDGRGRRESKLGRRRWGRRGRELGRGRRGRVVSDFIPVMCPYCGERVELNVEDDGWSRQSYVQDCPVCCQPWQVELIRDADGDWNATLKTGDE